VFESLQAFGQVSQTATNAIGGDSSSTLEWDVVDIKDMLQDFFRNEQARGRGAVSHPALTPLSTAYNSLSDVYMGVIQKSYVRVINVTVLGIQDSVDLMATINKNKPFLLMSLREIGARTYQVNMFVGFMEVFGVNDNLDQEDVDPRAVQVTIVSDPYFHAKSGFKL